MNENTSIFQQPLARALFKQIAGFVGFLVAYLLIGLILGFVDSNTNHSLEIFSDLGLCLAGIIGWMVFFAQFVLPVNKLQDRWKVVTRLIPCLLGGHHPAIFIENGFIQTTSSTRTGAVGLDHGERKEKAKIKGPGIIWLDNASAAVLHKTGRFTRTIGPGIHFTNHAEYIAATTDLHTLIQTIGPNETDEPFKMQDSNLGASPKDDQDYQTIKERARVTTAMTLDGVFVSASISITFRIKSTPGEGHTCFGFNSKNTENALHDMHDSVTHEPQLEFPVWDNLPAKMAASIWREYLGKFRLSELFEKNETRPDTTIQFINDLIHKRMTRPHVEMLDEFGQVVLNNESRKKDYLRLLMEKNKDEAVNLLAKIKSSEFVKLSESGIEVKNVTINKLFFTADVEEQLLSQWTDFWLKNTQKEHQQVELDRKLWKKTGQQEGLKDFALNASREITHHSSVSPANALEMLVHATFRGVQQDPELIKHLNNEIGGTSILLRDLSEIFSWLKTPRDPSA